MAIWGPLPKRGAQCFSLNRHMPQGGSQKLGTDGGNGAMRYHWPVSLLSVDWVRRNWGTGRFQANWLVSDAGKLTPRGRSRMVDIVPGPVRASMSNGRQATVWGAGVSPDELGAAAHPPPQPPAMPPDVAQMRVQAAQDIAAERIKAQQQLFREQLEWQQRQSDERYQRMEERMEERLAELERHGVVVDEDDEPSEWAWIKDLVMPLAPHLKELVPALLSKLAGGGKALPG